MFNRFEAKSFNLTTCYCKESYLDEDIYSVLWKLPDEVAEKDINSLIESYKELSKFIVILCPVCDSCYEECDCNNSVYKVDYEDNIYYYNNILPYEHFYRFDDMLFCSEDCILSYLYDKLPNAEHISISEFTPGHHQKCYLKITLNGITEAYSLHHFKTLEELKQTIELYHTNNNLTEED